MHKYFIKTPWLVKQLFSSYVWQMPAGENNLYLSFDDGPHPVITPWVLDELKKYNATATFFCIGKNAERYPDVYARIAAEGHAVGNHTHDHLNGWKTKNNAYIRNILKAGEFIKSPLFRPPYGRIKARQAASIKKMYSEEEMKIIMWDVLSADFDRDITPQQCAANVIEKATAGSIIVFHDSEKAWKNLEYALPRVMESFSEKGFAWQSLRF
jgi:peptidoglycan-N-acetylglucosamine deacetylase